MEILSVTHVTRALKNCYTYAPSIFLDRSESDSIRKFFKSFRWTDCVSPTLTVTKYVKEFLSVLSTCFVNVFEIRYKRPTHSAVAHSRISRKSAQGRAVIFSWA
jgi:hypothetical protein